MKLSFRKVIFFIFIIWWVVIQWVYSAAYPKPAEDFKEVFFYPGSGFFFLYFLYSRKQKVLSWNILSILLTLYFLLALLSLRSGIGWGDGIIEISRMILWLGLAFVFSEFETAELIKIFVISTLSAGLIALSTLLEAYGFNTWSRLPTHLTTMTPIGHVSYYAHFMVCHLPIAAFLFSSLQKKCQKIISALAFILIFLALWHTGVRASLMGFFLSFLGFFSTLFILKKISIKQVTIAVVLLLLGITLLAKFFTHYDQSHGPTAERLLRMSEIFSIKWDAENLDRISSGRWSPALHTLEAIKKKPFFGWGIDSYRFVYPEYAQGDSYTHNVWFIHPHNEILHQLTTVGMIGTFTFFSFWILLLVRSFQALKNNTHDAQTANLLLLGVGGLLVCHGTWSFDTNFQLPLARAFAALFGGILWGKLHETDSLDSSCLTYPYFAEKFSRWGVSGPPEAEGFTPRFCGEAQAWPVQTAIGKNYYHLKYYRMPIVVLVSVSIFFVSTYLASLYYVVKSERLEWRGSLQESIQAAKTALSLSPRTFDSQFRYLNLSFRKRLSEDIDLKMKNLLADYSYTVMTLMLAADYEYARGNFSLAKEYAEHALKNDPTLERAKLLLQSLK